MHIKKKMLKFISVDKKVNSIERFSELSSEELNDSIEKSVALAKNRIDSLAWRGSYDGNMTDGSCALDIVHTVIEGFLSGIYTWVDDINFETFLIQTTRGLISNMVTGKENRTTSRIELITDSPHDLLPASSNSPSDDCEEQEADDLLLDIFYALEENSHEQKIVEAIIEGNIERRNIIAHAGISARNYDNAHKRMKRFLYSDEWQKRLTSHHK